MKFKLSIILTLVLTCAMIAQNGNPNDYLSAKFHKERREALRKKMPKNTGGH
jgi:Xaa-Pro aminopeptidase